MTLEQFLKKLQTTPNDLLFEETMMVIDSSYEFSETAFDNGDVHNDVGENSGSCRLFAFAQLNKLSEQETLYCFAQYYRDVLQSPEGESHQNIRQFMQKGWSHVIFKHTPLKVK